MIESQTVKLSANENCYGCSPLVLKVIQDKLSEASVYPDMNPVALKQKLAHKYGVEVPNIITGLGSVGIIDGLIRTYVKDDEEVLTFENSFVAYNQLCGFHKKKCILVPLDNLRCNPEVLLSHITNKTSLVFIANPNNPTGTIISHTELECFLNKIPENIIVVIDEAYGEYVTDKCFPDSLQLQKRFKNLIILHSFSKIYGLAGLRIGFGIATTEKATLLSSTQIPYSLNYLSYSAAIAALTDTDFIKYSATQNALQREFLVQEFSKLGYYTISSEANFIYLWFSADEEKLKLYNLFKTNGILICDLQIFGQGKALRITIGKEDANRKIISLLREAK